MRTQRKVITIWTTVFSAGLAGRCRPKIKVQTRKPDKKGNVGIYIFGLKYPGPEKDDERLIVSAGNKYGDSACCRRQPGSKR
jgi:hypothetical protein